TGDVATWPVEVGDEASPDRVAPGRKDDRHRRGCGLGRERRRGIADDQSYLPAKKVRHQRRRIPARVEFDPDVLALDKACYLQALAERSHVVRHVSERSAVQKSHHRHRRLLRTCRERPRSGRAAEQRDELAPVTHSITSSARASSVGGTVRPSAPAVLRLMTSSILVGCSTGMSAGFAPLRIRAAMTPGWWYTP